MLYDAVPFTSIGGFSLPEERVIGESTYIVLDFPRCVDSVEAGECRFDPERDSKIDTAEGSREAD